MQKKATLLAEVPPTLSPAINPGFFFFFQHSAPDPVNDLPLNYAWRVNKGLGHPAGTSQRDVSSLTLSFAIRTSSRAIFPPQALGGASGRDCERQRWNYRHHMSSFGECERFVEDVNLLGDAQA